MNPKGDARRYVRAVEAAWAKLLGRPAVVSPRDFEAIDGWRRRGVPLAVVLEVLAAAGERRSGRAPKGLTSLANAVEEAFTVVSAGRTVSGAHDRFPDLGAARSAWEQAIARSLPGTPLHTLLTRLLSAEREGGGGAELDAALDAQLPEAAPDQLLLSANEHVARVLEPFRGRMSDDEFRKTSARALIDRLRLELALPRLSLTR